MVKYFKRGWSNGYDFSLPTKRSGFDSRSSHYVFVKQHIARDGTKNYEIIFSAGPRIIYSQSESFT